MIYNCSTHKVIHESIILQQFILQQQYKMSYNVYRAAYKTYPAHAYLTNPYHDASAADEAFGTTITSSPLS